MMFDKALVFETTSLERKCALRDVAPKLHDVEIITGLANRGIILLCDHASNHVPEDLTQLGLPAEQFERHIGYDIGAAMVTRELARLLKAPAILTRFSRLIIDPNRGWDDPTLVMQLSDGAVIPGNARIDDHGIETRLTRFYDPYDQAITKLLDAEMQSVNPLIISMHSFTPIWRGIPRPWEIGLLWDKDKRLANYLHDQLSNDPNLTVGDNEPYRGGLPGDTIDRHATKRGLANILIELRQDLIACQEGAHRWAARLAPMIESASALDRMHQIQHFN